MSNCWTLASRNTCMHTTLCEDRISMKTALTATRLYRDQLTVTERHLDGLIEDANATLKLLTSLSNSFGSVEAQTSTFQSQCEELLQEQRRLEDLADEVGTDLHYYAYLDNATRRLNAPGASRLVDDASFGEMAENIDACIVFMENHVRIPFATKAQMLMQLADIPRPRYLSCTIHCTSHKSPSSS
jgi:hypothetical protein